jgi:hypothetical protein
MADLPERTKTSRYRTIILAGCDRNYFYLLSDMLLSVDPHRRARGIDIGIIDYGLAPDQIQFLQTYASRIIKPTWRLEIAPGADPTSGIWASHLFLPVEFPGYDIYFWIDPDAWLQVPETLDAFIEGAGAHGAAVVAENHPSYRFQPRLQYRNIKSFIRGYGLTDGLWLNTKPHINMGVFAIRGDAPHWQKWRERLVAAARRTGRIYPNDQFAFNQIVHQDKIPTLILPPELNWIPNRGPPAWDASARQFVTPDESRRPLGIVHLAGQGAKLRKYRISVLGGGTMSTELRYSSVRSLYGHPA